MAHRTVVAATLVGTLLSAGVGRLAFREHRESPCAGEGRAASVVEKPAVIAGKNERPAALPPGPAPGLVALGRAAFFDPNLSTPPGTSCATCHDPVHGFAGNNGSRNGVARGSRGGHFARRNTPSVRYLKYVRPFHFHWEEDVELPDAFGGFFWDGRSDSLAALVRQPLLNADEMGNREPQTVADAVHRAGYAGQFAAVFGASDDAEGTLQHLGEALEAFLLSDEMAPFSSAYDDFVRGRAALSPLEAEGLRLFKDAAKGNCASCHKLNDRSPDPERSLFTDYGFEVVGVPRNRHVPATQDPAYADLGLCARKGAAVAAAEARLCGAFRTPSLRNVALRESFMHNGALSSLRDVVAFYATRDTAPERWYRGGVSYDDLPSKARDFVNVDVPPYDRPRGAQPRLDGHDIDAIVAFLGTLTDSPERIASAP
jgi:cytochrome c peroxidase